MALLYYEIIFAISFVLTAVYVLIWRKHFDVNITAIFFLIPLVNLGYVFRESSTELETIITSTKLIYIGGCFLIFFITMCVLSLCDIKVNKWIRLAAFLMSSFMYYFVITIGKNEYFYKSVKLKWEDENLIILKEYGPAHTAFYIMIGIYSAISISAIIYSLLKKRQIPNRLLYLLFLPEIISMTGYFGRAVSGLNLEIVPVTYVLAQIVYLFIVKKISVYKVADMVVESMVQSGEIGFISTDLKERYLGSNETARMIIPKLAELAVDQRITDFEELDSTVNHWLIYFEANSDKYSDNIYRVQTDEDRKNDKFYIIQVKYLYDGKKKLGYQIFLDDDTQNQQYISLLDNYNEELQEEVERQTKHIVEMHDNLILGMATMVESRDNSTGGHIKRTSIGVRLLIDEMRRDPGFELSESFCKNIIKAAPMHDIGKIAVDDKVLKKAGRFTDDEFNEMKKHAAEGARIIREILKETDDKDFKIIAENVAHYHHERWDGSGYPEGLKGEEIPLEARIMAIADVYDALVSKRVYKDSMSFEQADKIIMEGMGKHFDESLKPFYISARPKLEKYYSSLGADVVTLQKQTG